MATRLVPDRDMVDWTGSERVYSNPWFSVERVGRWHRVVCGRGVVAMPFVSAGSGSDPMILAVRVPRHAVGQVCLELPRGGLEGDEDPVAGAARETLEESGWDALSEGVVVGHVHPDTGILSAGVPVVAFEVVYHSMQTDGEVVGFEFVPWSEFPERVLGNGGCAFSLAAWVAADIARRKGILGTRGGPCGVHRDLQAIEALQGI